MSPVDTAGPADARIPLLKIRQPRTRDAELVPDGVWFVTSDLDGHSVGREVVLLDVRPQRGMYLHFDEGEELNALLERILKKTGVAVPPQWKGPVCHSYDRIRPVERHGIPTLARTCAACPMSRWRTVNGRKVQDCGERYRLLFYDVALGMPVVFHARGSGVRPATDLLVDLEAASLRDARPSFAYSIQLGTRQLEAPTGSYFVPVFGRPEPIEDESLIAHYAAARAAFTRFPAEESQ